MRLSISLSNKIKTWTFCNWGRPSEDQEGVKEYGQGQNHSAQSTKNAEEELGRVWWYESFSVLSVCISCISCGNFLGYTSSAVPSMSEDFNTFGGLKSNQIALIGGLGPLGALLGALLSAIPLRFIGPRRTIALFGIPLLIASWLTIGLSKGIVSVLVGRFLGGIGVGATISSAPLYVIDISSTSRRGKNGIMPQLLMISGILISYILGAFQDWSCLSLISCSVSIVAAIFIAFAPDSPKWLIFSESSDKAFHILEKIHGTTTAKVMVQNMESSFASSLALDSPSLISILRNKATIKSTLVCLGVISVQQLTGVNGITFFAASIFKHSGSGADGHLPSIILATTQLLASFLSRFFVERFGRTFLLKISSATLTISGSVLGIYFYFLLNHEEFYWLPLAALIIFAFGFAIGLGPVTWILVAEILPQQVRNLVNPLIIGYNWFCVFLITTSFPWLKEEISYYGIFWLYATIAAIGFIFVCVLVPETKGKSLDEIQMHFAGTVEKSANSNATKNSRSVATI